MNKKEISNILLKKIDNFDLTGEFCMRRLGLGLGLGLK